MWAPSARRTLMHLAMTSPKVCPLTSCMVNHIRPLGRRPTSMEMMPDAEVVPSPGLLRKRATRGAIQCLSGMIFIASVRPRACRDPPHSPMPPIRAGRGLRPGKPDGVVGGSAIGQYGRRAWMCRRSAGSRQSPVPRGRAGGDMLLAGGRGLRRRSAPVRTLARRRLEEVERGSASGFGAREGVLAGF